MISIPNRAKWDISTGTDSTKDSRVSNSTAVSSAYSESGTENSSPLVLNLLPVITSSYLVWNRHNGRLWTFLHVIITAARKNRNNRGPKMSPCFTPMMHSMDFVISLTVNFTWTFACKDLSNRISFGGTPNFSRIIQSISLRTRSKAFTRTRNKIDMSSPRSLLFFIAVLTVKLLSGQPLFERKPHCPSWSRFSSIAKRGKVSRYDFVLNFILGVIQHPLCFRFLHTLEI